MTRNVELKITSFSKKGNGVGVCPRPNAPDLCVEVPFTMPEDLVRVQLFRKRGGVYNGKLEELISPSENRISPRCIHFAACGGCRFQHVSYQEQLKHKENFVKDCFKNLLDQVIFHPIIPSVREWQYRNKMEYSFSSDSQGRQYLGLILDSSRGKVFNLTECHLTHHWFVDALKSTRKWWQESDLDAYHPMRNSGSLRTLTLREGFRTGDRMVILTVSGNPDYALKRHHIDNFVASIRDAIEPVDRNSALSIFLRIQQVGKGMATNFYEMHLYGPDHIREVLHINIDANDPPFSLNFDISPSAFFQPNPEQAERLYSTALRMANISSNAVVYDLYCGAGALGLSVSRKVKQVFGIELSPESALDARTNAKNNHCDNVTILTGSVGHLLSQIEQKQLPPPDVVIVDPPRPGLDGEAIKHILSLKPKKILYISCNPITQALNIAELVQHSYQLKEIQPLDQFPQTAHIENIAVLECKSQQY